MSMIEVDTSEVEAMSAEIGRHAATVVPTSVGVLSTVAADMRSEASANAPVLTGELAGGVFNRGGGLLRTVGSDDRQGFYQEFGTSVHPAQPWLLPAAARAQIQLRMLMAAKVAGPW